MRRDGPRTTVRMSSSSSRRARLQGRVRSREAALDLSRARAHGNHGASSKAAATNEFTRTTPVSKTSRWCRGRVGRGSQRRSSCRGSGRKGLGTGIEAEVRQSACGTSLADIRISAPGSWQDLQRTRTANRGRRNIRGRRVRRRLRKDKVRIGNKFDVTRRSRNTPLVQRGAHVGDWRLGDRLSRKGDLSHGFVATVGPRLLQRVGSATDRVGVTMRLRRDGARRVWTGGCRTVGGTAVLWRVQHGTSRQEEKNNRRNSRWKTMRLTAVECQRAWRAEMVGVASVHSIGEGQKQADSPGHRRVSRVEDCKGMNVVVRNGRVDGCAIAATYLSIWSEKRVLLAPGVLWAVREKLEWAMMGATGTSGGGPGNIKWASAHGARAMPPWARLSLQPSAARRARDRDHRQHQHQHQAPCAPGQRPRRRRRRAVPAGAPFLRATLSRCCCCCCCAEPRSPAARAAQSSTPCEQQAAPRPAELEPGNSLNDPSRISPISAARPHRFSRAQLRHQPARCPPADSRHARAPTSLPAAGWTTEDDDDRASSPR